MIIKKFETVMGSASEYVYSISGRQGDEVVNFDAYRDTLFAGESDECSLIINIQDGSEPELVALDPDQMRAMRESGELRRETEEEREEWLHPKNEVKLTVEEACALRDFLNDPKTIEKLGL